MFASLCPRRLYASLVAVLAFGLGGCTSVQHGLWRHRMERVLSATHRTEHLDLYFRPGSKCSGQAERLGALAERELARICALLEVPNDARYSIFFFDDAAEMRATARAKISETTQAFAARGAAFVGYGDESDIAHELVHLVADAKIGDVRHSLRVEGLANALLESSHGVQVHAFAKYYRLQGKLPRLAEIPGGSAFFAWGRGQGISIYDVSASWMRFLLETRGPAKVKQYYLGQPVQEVFGVTDDALEAEWLAALDAYDLRFDEQRRIRNQFGGPLIVNAGDGLRIGLRAARRAEVFAWSKDGVPLRSTTGMLPLRDLKPTDSGTYELTVRDPQGAVLDTTKFVVLVLPPSNPGQ